MTITTLVLAQHFRTDNRLVSRLTKQWSYEGRNPRFLGYAAASQKVILEAGKHTRERRKHDVVYTRSSSAEAMLHAEDAADRTFAREPGEGEVLWWLGMPATIKVTKEQTGGRYALVEGRGLLHPRRRVDLLRGRSEDKGAARLAPLRSQGRTPRLHRRLGAGEAVVRLFAWGFGGPRQGDERAGKVAFGAAAAGGVAR
jgi:hypothetical protein